MDELRFKNPRWLRGFFRILQRLPIPGWLIAVLVVVGIAGVYHWVAWRSGHLEFGQVNRNLASQGLYVVTATYYWVLLSGRAERELRKFFSQSGRSQLEVEDTIADFNSLPDSAALVVVGLGMFLSILGYRYFAVVAFPVIGLVLPGLNVAIYGYSGAAFLLIIARMLRQAAYMRQLYAETEVDLFRPRPIYALSSFASFSSAAILTLVYVLVLIAFPAFLLTPLGVAVQLLIIVTAGFLFFSPLAGVNTRMKQAKQELLDSANEDLRELYQRIRAAAQSQDHAALDKLQGPLSTLRESREMLRSFPTWPWQPNTLRNLVAPLVVPVVVYFVQLLVTRVIDR